MVQVTAERGAVAVTVGDIVRRAGVSRRTFYELFDDREACLLAVFDHAVREMQAVLLPAYAAGGSRWRERIRAGLEALLRFLDEEPELGALCVVDALSGGARLLARRAQVLAVLQHVVDGGRAEVGRRGEPGPLAAEGVVGAVFAVLHARLAGGSAGPLIDLLGPLMGMIVLPYQGAAAASRETLRSALPAAGRGRRNASGARGRLGDPLEGLNMRLTYRTMRVLAVLAEQPGASNRRVANGAGILDQGQVSKLLARQQTLGLAHNDGEGGARGAPNAWTLTDRGTQVEQALSAGRFHAATGGAHEAA
jgi:AcrR family transcriptional regulator